MTFAISSKDLRVDISQPGHLYSGTRFDWNGLVAQVSLDGSHTYCAYESNIPMTGSGGLGLCNAFMGMMEDNFDAVPVGGKFMCVGIGNAVKTGGKYTFMTPYPVEPFGSRVTISEGNAVFEQESVPCNGFNYRMKKELTVNDNVLTIKTTEFNHNFVCLDWRPIGPDYELALPYTPDIERKAGEYHIGQKKITLAAAPKGNEDYFYFFVKNCKEAGDRHFWELTHKPSGVSMRETADFVPEALNVWGKSHVFSPEVFVGIDIAPGKAFEWTRKYEFFVKG